MDIGFWGLEFSAIGGLMIAVSKIALFMIPIFFGFCIIMFVYNMTKVFSSIPKTTEYKSKQELIRERKYGVQEQEQVSKQIPISESEEYIICDKEGRIVGICDSPSGIQRHRRADRNDEWLFWSHVIDR